MKLKFSPADYDGQLVAELWIVPRRLAHPGTVHQGRDVRGFRRRRSDAGPFLEQRGVDLTGEQQTKTKSALESFSSDLR